MCLYFKNINFILCLSTNHFDIYFKNGTHPVKIDGFQFVLVFLTA